MTWQRQMFRKNFNLTNKDNKFLLLSLVLFEIFYILYSKMFIMQQQPQFVINSHNPPIKAHTNIIIHILSRPGEYELPILLP